MKSNNALSKEKNTHCFKKKELQKPLLKSQLASGLSFESIWAKTLLHEKANGREINFEGMLPVD